MHRDIKPSNILVCQTFANVHKEVSKFKTQETIRNLKFKEMITEINKNEERSDSTEEIELNLNWLDKQQEVISSGETFVISSDKTFVSELKPSNILFSFSSNDFPKDEIMENEKKDEPLCRINGSEKTSELLSSTKSDTFISFAKVKKYPFSNNEPNSLKNEDLQNEKNTDIVIKLIDFGVSKKFTFGEPCFSPNGDPSFQAPEMRKEGAYDHTIDLWGVGLIFLGLLQGVEVERCNLKKIKHMELKGTLDEKGVDLLQRLLSLDPRRRGEAEEAMRHEWFHDMNYM